MDPNERIQLDDITFDDVIAGDGVAVEEVPTEDVVDEVQEDVVEEQDDAIDELSIDDDSEEEYEEDDEDDDEEYEEDDQEEDDEEYEESDDDYEDQSVVNEILDKLGYDLEGVDYPDTAEGLANLTSDMASKMADDRIDDVLENFPLVKQHLEYVLSGGQSREFMKANDPTEDYGSFALQEDDHRSQKGILADYFTVKGHDQEFITDMINDLEDSGKLYDKANIAKNALAKMQDAQRDQMIEQQRAEQREHEAGLNEFWAGVANTLSDNDELAGISIAGRDKEDFFDYLTTPVNKQGQTQRDVDHSRADLEVKLAIDYLVYKGFNLNDIIDTKARTKSVKSLRDKIGRQEEYVKSARKSSRRSKNVNLDDLDLSI